MYNLYKTGLIYIVYRVQKPCEFTDSYPELIGFSTGNHPEGLYRDE